MCVCVCVLEIRSHSPFPEDPEAALGDGPSDAQVELDATAPGLGLATTRGEAAVTAGHVDGRRLLLNLLLLRLLPGTRLFRIVYNGRRTVYLRRRVSVILLLGLSGDDADGHDQAQVEKHAQVHGLRKKSSSQMPRLPPDLARRCRCGRPRKSSR